jgi:hypothetical protein
VLVPDEPAGGLGDIARIRVLGREDDERPPELLVERRNDERQGRLRDPCACVRKLPEKRAKSLTLGTLADERMENGSVHDD